MESPPTPPDAVSLSVLRAEASDPASGGTGNSAQIQLWGEEHDDIILLLGLDLALALGPDPAGIWALLVGTARPHQVFISSCSCDSFRFHVVVGHF